MLQLTVNFIYLLINVVLEIENLELKFNHLNIRTDFELVLIIKGF